MQYLYGGCVISEFSIGEILAMHKEESPNKINKKISDLGLSILSLISNNSRIKVPGIFVIISRTDSNINIDKIRYSIKTELKEIVELRGSKKTGGYHLID